MPVRVDIPIRICVDPAALEADSDLENAFILAVQRALVNSREVVLAPRGGYMDVNLHPPVFNWSGTGLTEVSESTQQAVVERLTASLSTVIDAVGLSMLAKQEQEIIPPLSEDPTEAVDPDRLYAFLRRYRIPSYQDEGDETTVEYEPAEENDRGGYLPFPEWSEYTRSEIMEDVNLQAFLYDIAVGQYGETVGSEWIGLVWSTGNSLVFHFVPRANPGQDQRFFTIPLASFRRYVFEGPDPENPYQIAIEML
ncbi:MAG: hypothetical protein F6K65_43645 [Moorea sp. SIO3C2]|nr:hypothetical protein [Moorena sp. SIO3C2]